jgi:hypothetical protein
MVGHFPAAAMPMACTMLVSLVVVAVQPPSPEQRHGYVVVRTTTSDHGTVLLNTSMVVQDYVLAAGLGVENGVRF